MPELKTYRLTEVRAYEVKADSREEAGEMISEHGPEVSVEDPVSDLGLQSDRLDEAGDSHAFMVVVSGCTAEQAEQVIAERTGHDEDYGFEYTIEVA
jgi:hypothetical protein